MEQVRSQAGVRPPISDARSLFSKKSILGAALVSAAYLLLASVVLGFRTDQLALVIIFNACYFLSVSSRKFILAFSVFFIYWIVFDFMKALPNYAVNRVHIESLYLWEKSWFGLNTAAGRITLNEYFAEHHSLIVDIVAGLFYLCWVPVPLAFAIVLYRYAKPVYFRFALTFLLVNLIGFTIYYLYPAAPPWYVALKGFQFEPATPGNTAALARFDAWAGVPVFHALYAKSSNVFAAMPSLHAAYMLIVFYFSGKLRWKRWFYASAIITAGIWFSAVYSSHHYLLDVLAGALCAMLGILLFHKLSSSPPVKALVSRLRLRMQS